MTLKVAGPYLPSFTGAASPTAGWGHIKIYGEDGAICLYNQMNMQVRRGRDWRVEDVNWELLELTPADRILHGVTTWMSREAICGWPMRRSMRSIKIDRTRTAAKKAWP